MSRANPRRVSSGHSELCYPLMTGNHGGKFVAAKTPVYLQYPSTTITAAIGCCDFNSIRVCTWMLIVWLYLSSLGAQSLHAQSGSNGVHGFGSTRSAAYQCVNTATGRIIPYCYMRFSAPVGIRTTGGHFHEVNRPSGKVATSRNGSFRDTVTIQANALGIATVWYKTNSRTIGQTEKLKVCGTVCNYHVYHVGLSNLHRVYPSSKWILVGGFTTGHGSIAYNHFMTLAAQAKLRTVVSNFLTRHPAQGKVALNDMSLNLGGVFDLRRDWSPPHRAHSYGTAVDVQARTVSTGYSIPASRVDDFLIECRGAGAKHAALESPGTSNQHIHCGW